MHSLSVLPHRTFAFESPTERTMMVIPFEGGGTHPQAGARDHSRLAKKLSTIKIAKVETPIATGTAVGLSGSQPPLGSTISLRP